MRIRNSLALSLPMFITLTACGGGDDSNANSANDDGGVVDGSVTLPDGTTPPNTDASVAPNADASVAPGHDGSTGPGPDGSTSLPDGSTPETGGGGDGSVPPTGASVLTFHLHGTRDGAYVQPAITKASALKMAMDTTFSATFTGNVYAQPLYVESGVGGKGTFYVVTEDNAVYAFDETTGGVAWGPKTPSPAAAQSGSCGDVQPLGITGTPAIDLTRRAMYFDTAVQDSQGNLGKHLVHALSIDDGSELAGFPVDVTTVTSGTTTFETQAQNQRSALLIVNDVLYVNFGGHDGDCASSRHVLYHGWTVGIPLGNPAGMKAYMTPSTQAGMWAAGGPATDGTSVFVATGNGDSGNFGFQESVLRLGAGPTFSAAAADYWSAGNWSTLDTNDKDIGGAGPIVADLPGATPQKVVLAFGKDGFIYVLDRNTLGGKGAELAKKQVLTEVPGTMVEHKAAAAIYTTSTAVYAYSVAADDGPATGCPAGQKGDLVAMKITAGSPPTISVVWCAETNGKGLPIVTTSDGTNDALVWATGAAGSQRLYSWDALTGAPVYTGGGSTDHMANLEEFTTPIAVKGRLFTAGNGQLYAFSIH
jgi:outer membrane protein assembly factor BamB